ncbi:SMC family ATPase [Staphylococcus saccharolyticus]
MKPINLEMNNFGPFLKENIDFRQVEENQLFLISGKTGSGKTMIFDAIVYALYGEASTKSRKEGDLRSHFADGKLAMSVTYEFNLNGKIFKIHREAPFIKEGNSTKTQAKLDIYELVDDKYELRESKVNQGNQFIIQLMGADANQFRQLFILPQGEFKKFLQSNSKEKQSILRTLFNSERFDEIRNQLVEQVRNEKVQIEKRYNQIDHLWTDLEAFNSDKLEEFKGLQSSQIDKIIQILPVLESAKEEKATIENELEELTHKYDVNHELQHNLDALHREKEQFEKLKSEQIEIENLKQELKQIQESNVLINNYKRQQVVKKEINTLNTSIKQTKNKEIEIKQDYHTLKSKKEKLRNQISDKTKDYEIIDNYTNEINNIKLLIDATERYIKEEQQFKKIQQEQLLKHEELKELETKLGDIELLISKIDSIQTDLNNKETFVNEIKSALSIGDTCPICGNVIHSLGQRIDFNSIATKKQKIEQLEKKKLSIRESIIKTKSRLDELRDREKELNFKQQEQQNLGELRQQLDVKEKAKQKQQEHNKMIENVEEKENEIEKESHRLDLKLSDKEAQIKQIETKINDFESNTEFQSVSTFEKYYIEQKVKVQNHIESKEQLSEKITKLANDLSIEENNIQHFVTHLKTVITEDEELDLKIKNEMKQLGFDSVKQIEEALCLNNQKEDIEERINNFNKKYQSFEIEIERLSQLVKDKKLENLDKLKEKVVLKRQKLDQINSETVAIKCKNENNLKNINKIKGFVEILNDELKDQKEIFLLTEILSGKNSRKLMLENYVLIYYLEKIILQANQRLSVMSGNRYQLVRREAVSQGFSGLEIDVFDFHSNKSRHISSLSGGETFQASLALGLSEVVQQESGEINLQSMFIDEGFGTLDQETLETAIDTLINLKSSGRMVGIISHVSELKQRIPLILEVSSSQYHSSTRFRKN